MKLFKFLIIGILFGIIMTKSEAISWFRIQEMFRFESFHMYGIIGTAVILGAIAHLLLKKFNIKSIDGEVPKYRVSEMQIPRLLIGGTIFGLGWALTGACPGPLYTLLGHGIGVIIIVIISAILGTFVYGLLKERLPH